MGSRPSPTWSRRLRVSSGWNSPAPAPSRRTSSPVGAPKRTAPRAFCSSAQARSPPPIGAAPSPSRTRLRVARSRIGRARSFFSAARFAPSRPRGSWSLSPSSPPTTGSEGSCSRPRGPQRSGRGASTGCTGRRRGGVSLPASRVSAGSSMRRVTLMRRPSARSRTGSPPRWSVTWMWLARPWWRPVAFSISPSGARPGPSGRGCGVALRSTSRARPRSPWSSVWCLRATSCGTRPKMQPE